MSERASRLKHPRLRGQFPNPLPNVLFVDITTRDNPPFSPDHSVISEDSSSVILVPPTSGSLSNLPGAVSSSSSKFRFVSVTCGKCSSVCCGARRTCSNCGAKLRTVQESETAFSTNRKMTKLPPLPAQPPSKSDRVAYQAFKVCRSSFLFCVLTLVQDLTRRYREAGVDPDKLGKQQSNKQPSLSSVATAKLDQSASKLGVEADSGVSVVSDDEKSDDDSVTLYQGEHAGGEICFFSSVFFL
jgi:hypothetical protein